MKVKGEFGSFVWSYRRLDSKMVVIFVDLGLVFVVWYVGQADDSLQSLQLEVRKFKRDG